MKIPKISIGLPVFNGEAYLAGAIQSLLEQSYRDFELIISDNASTDATGQICRDFAAQDSRIRYYRNAMNIGGAPNANRVFELATGEFFKWASHDDLYPKEMLRRCCEVLEKAPASVALVYTHFELIDESGNSLGIKSDRVGSRESRPHLRLSRLLMNIGYYTTTYALMRSNVLRRTRLEESFPYSDRVLLAELAMLGELWEIPEPLLLLRIHAGRSVTANPTPDAIREWYDPHEAKKALVLPLNLRADLEIARSALRLPLRWSDRLQCLVVALRRLNWSRPLSRSLRFVQGLWRTKRGALGSATR
jgi:glycosyltransferase involved in cell wall biosynthesis